MNDETSRTKTVWQDWAELAAWLVSLATPVVMELPRLSPLSSGGSWSPVVLYVLTVLCGLVLLMIRKWRWPAIVTAALAISCLAGGLWALASYRHDLLLWSCEYADRGRVVVGSDDRLAPLARDHRQRFGSSCTDLIEDAGGNTEALWPREQIIGRYETLGWRYTLTMILLAIAAFFALETWKAIDRSHKGKE